MGDRYFYLVAKHGLFGFKDIVSIHSSLKDAKDKCEENKKFKIWRLNYSTLSFEMVE